ncbi:MAG: hypothetical protein ACTSR8_21280 [Promethearchaeota archaeon]
MDIPEIIFTDSLGELDFISMDGSEFVKLAKLLDAKVLYSSFDGRNISDDFLFLINNGIIFVPHSGNTEPLEEYLKIRECGFKDLFTYLAAMRIRVCDYTEYKEFKNSEFFGFELANIQEFREAKKSEKDA